MAVPVACLALLAAGCGGSANPGVAALGTTTRSGPNEGSSGQSLAAASNEIALGVRFATCMRDHGVPSFPDPETGGGIQIPVALAKNPSPAFTSAMRACTYLIPADAAPPVVSASQRAAALKVAQCMREHGVPNYPNPTYKDGHAIPPSIADPAINPGSPAFGAAMKRCQSP